jgi:hypothetical protein
MAPLRDLFVCEDHTLLDETVRLEVDSFAYIRRYRVGSLDIVLLRSKVKIYFTRIKEYFSLFLASYLQDLIERVGIRYCTREESIYIFSSLFPLIITFSLHIFNLLIYSTMVTRDH